MLFSRATRRCRRRIGEVAMSAGCHVTVGHDNQTPRVLSKRNTRGELPLHRVLADKLSIELLCLGFQLFRSAFDSLPSGFRVSLRPFHRALHLIPLRLFR